jgi:hypothetical protein
MGNEFKTMDGVNSGYEIKELDDSTSIEMKAVAGPPDPEDSPAPDNSGDYAKAVGGASTPSPPPSPPPTQAPPASSSAPKPVGYGGGPAGMRPGNEEFIPRKGTKARDILLKGFEEIDNSIVMKGEGKGSGKHEKHEEKHEEKREEEHRKIYDPQDGPGLGKLRGQIETACVSPGKIKNKGGFPGFAAAERLGKILDEKKADKLIEATRKARGNKWAQHELASIKKPEIKCIDDSIKMKGVVSAVRTAARNVGAGSPISTQAKVLGQRAVSGLKNEAKDAMAGGAVIRDKKVAVAPLRMPPKPTVNQRLHTDTDQLGMEVGSNRRSMPVDREWGGVGYQSSLVKRKPNPNREAFMEGFNREERKIRNNPGMESIKLQRKPSEIIGEGPILNVERPIKQSVEDRKSLARFDNVLNDLYKVHDLPRPGLFKEVDESLIAEKTIGTFVGQEVAQMGKNVVAGAKKVASSGKKIGKRVKEEASAFNEGLHTPGAELTERQRVKQVASEFPNEEIRSRPEPPKPEPKVATDVTPETPPKSGINRGVKIGVGAGAGGLAGGYYLGSGSETPPESKSEKKGITMPSLQEKYVRGQSKFSTGNTVKAKGIISDIAGKLKKKPATPFEGSLMQARQDAGRHLKRNLTKEGQVRQDKYDDILSTTQEFNARHGIKEVNDSLMVEKGVGRNITEALKHEAPILVSGAGMGVAGTAIYAKHREDELKKKYGKEKNESYLAGASDRQTLGHKRFLKTLNQHGKFTHDAASPKPEELHPSHLNEKGIGSTLFEHLKPIGNLSDDVVFYEARQAKKKLNKLDKDEDKGFNGNIEKKAINPEKALEAAKRTTASINKASDKADRYFNAFSKVTGGDIINEKVVRAANKTSQKGREAGLKIAKYGPARTSMLIGSGKSADKLEKMPELQLNWKKAPKED